MQESKFGENRVRIDGRCVFVVSATANPGTGIHGMERTAWSQNRLRHVKRANEAVRAVPSESRLLSSAGSKVALSITLRHMLS